MGICSNKEHDTYIKFVTLYTLKQYARNNNGNYTDSYSLRKLYGRIK